MVNLSFSSYLPFPLLTLLLGLLLSFLWKAVMFEPDDFRIGVTVKVYLWTGANDYMILSDHDLLSIGGG